VMCQRTIDDGSALSQFRELLRRQGGDATVVDDPAKLVVAPVKTVWRAPRAGHLKSFANDQIGMMLTELGGGRHTKDDVPDLAVGFTFAAKVAAKLKKGDPVVTVHHHAAQAKLVAELEARFFRDVVRFSPRPVRPPRLITATVKS